LDLSYHVYHGFKDLSENSITILGLTWSFRELCVSRALNLIIFMARMLVQSLCYPNEYPLLKIPMKHIEWAPPTKEGSS